MSKLASISGEAESALEELAKLCEAYQLAHDLTLDPEREVQQIRRIVECAINEGVEPNRLSIQFGLPVGMAYYTGMIFELRTPTDSNADIKLGGGGRYDGLAYALGSRADLPALGFALNLDEILATLQDDSRQVPANGPTVLARDADANPAKVTRVAKMLRDANEQVIVSYGDISEAKQLAESVGQNSVKLVKADGSTETVPL